MENTFLFSNSLQCYLEGNEVLHPQGLNTLTKTGGGESLSYWDWLPCVRILPQFFSTSALPPQPSARGGAHLCHSCSWLLFQIWSVQLPLAVGLSSLEGLTPSIHSAHHHFAPHLSELGFISFWDTYLSFSSLPPACVYTQHTHIHRATEFYSFFPYSFSPPKSFFQFLLSMHSVGIKL